MNYGDFGMAFFTGSVQTIIKAEYAKDVLKVTFTVKRIYGAGYTSYLVVASDKYVPWIKKIRVGDHVFMVCYMNFIGKDEEKKSNLVLSPSSMFLVDDKVHERPDSIIIQK